MSEPVADLYVEIRPDARRFEAELAAEIKKATDAVRQRFKSSLSVGAFGLAESTGALGRAQATAAQQTQLDYYRRLAPATAAYTREVEKEGRAYIQAGSKARILRGVTVGGAAGIASLGFAARRGILDLAEWGEAAGGAAEQVAKLGKGVVTLSFKDTGQALGNLAALSRGDNRDAARGQAAALKRESELQRAIELTAEFVKVREAAAKATGQQGTAEGVVKTQLEAQLRILRNQVALLKPGERAAGFGQLGLGPNGGVNASLVARTAPTRATDQDFALKQARANATKTAADDVALYRERRSFLKGLISRIEEAGATTNAAKANLLRLYGQLDTADSALAQARQDALERQQARLQTQISLAQTGVAIQAANARTQTQEIGALAAEGALARKYAEDKRLDAEQRAGFELQAATADKQIFSIQQAAAEAARQKAEEEKRLAEEERRQNEEKLKRQRDAFKQLRELRIENNIAKAGLTTSIADDRKAIQVQIKYYRELIKNTTGLEREQARSQLIAARGALQGLKGTATASIGDFFREVISDFRTFGSNFTSGGGALSPQGARGQFAANALSRVSGKSIEVALAEERTRTGKAQLTEQKKQTELLSSIAKSVGGSALLGAGKQPAKVPVGSMESAILGAGIALGS